MEETGKEEEGAEEDDDDDGAEAEEGAEEASDVGELFGPVVGSFISLLLSL